MKTIANQYNQKGNVLLISLILLGVLSVYGASSIRGAINEDRISVNIQERHLALEGAESAIRFGEITLSSFPSTADFRVYDTSSGQNPPNLTAWDSATGVNSSAFVIPNGTWLGGAGEAESPTYKIEIFSSGNDLETGDGRTTEQRLVPSIIYHRILGRGTGRPIAGGAANSVSSAIIESVLIKQ